MKYAFSALAVILMSQSVAQEQPTLKQLDAVEQVDSAMDIAERLKASFEVAMRRRASDCGKAIGFAPFCDCILKELPIAWTFADYVAITTRSREENGYDKLDANHRAAYEMVAPIRDKCVRQINRTR
jgi:hypothetical protein